MTRRGAAVSTPDEKSVAITDLTAAQPPGATRPRRRRGWGIAAGSLLTVLILVALGGVPLYMHPVDDDTSGVEAVLVLGPLQGPRVDLAREISAANGNVPIVLSVPTESRRTTWHRALCREQRMVCLSPSPFTTKGEVAIANELREEQGIETIAVVTMTPHVSRSRFIFDRCFAGDAHVVSSGFVGGPADWSYQYAYQTAAFIKNAVMPCD